MNMNFDQARFNMVEQQIRPLEVLDSRVLSLLETIHREDFVPVRYRKLAFADIAVPLDCGQCMMRPKIEARMLQAVALRGQFMVDYCPILNRATRPTTSIWMWTGTVKLEPA